MVSGDMSIKRCVVLLAVAALATSTLGGCVSQRIPLTHIEVPIPDVPLLDLIPGFREGNFRGLTWTEAFDRLHGKLSTEYPFTEWKQVDWTALHDTYAPRVAQAEADEDACRYYEALRGYLYAIADANVGLDVQEDCMETAIAGSYGFACLPLDDGRTIAHYILVGGPAQAAGMAWGAEIVSWNGVAVTEALANTSVLWADIAPATTEGLRLARHQFLSRGPVDSEVEIGFKNPGAEEATVAKVTAEADDYECLYAWSGMGTDIGDFENAFTTQTLPSGYGCITMRFVAPTVFMPFPDRGFKKAILSFSERKVPGLIIDLRGNMGGDNTLVPGFVGHFQATSAQYADFAYAKNRDGEFVVVEKKRLSIEPRDPAFAGPVVVIVDSETTGAGEGLAMALQRLPQARVVGYHGTRGAFSADGGNVSMPGGHNVWYPIGRSLDFFGNIQLEANADGIGGVTPDVRLPVTFENVKARFVDGDDPLRDEAVALLNQATGR